MRVENSEVALRSFDKEEKRRRVEEKFRFWIGDEPPEPPSAGVAAPPQVEPADGKTAARDLQTILKEINDRSGEILKGLSIKVRSFAETFSMKSASLAAMEDESADNSVSPELEVLRSILEQLSGGKIKIRIRAAHSEARAELSAKQSSAPNENRAGFGLEYDRKESYYESQTVEFSAGGVVRTADGKEIAFNFNLKAHREFYSETSVSVRAGDAVQKDPLVINFDGRAADLIDKKIDFDLDADGKEESINFLKAGSGFLVFDKNANNIVDDGSELFGPKTGDGFEELAAYDEDADGFIDEDDSTFDKLRVWTGREGDRDFLSPLKAKNVGAIMLARRATPFAIKNAQNASLGEILTTGIYMKEDGKGAGSVQQINLSI